MSWQDHRHLEVTICLIPGFGGAFLAPEWRDALWAKFPWKRHDDGGSSSGDPPESSEPEGSGEALRHQPENRRQVEDAGEHRGSPDRPRAPHATVLSVQEEAIIVATGPALAFTSAESLVYDASRPASADGSAQPSRGRLKRGRERVARSIRRGFARVWTGMSR